MKFSSTTALLRQALCLVVATLAISAFASTAKADDDIPANDEVSVLFANIAGAYGFSFANVGDFGVGYEHRLLGRHHILGEFTFLRLAGDSATDDAMTENIDERTIIDLFGIRVGYRYAFYRTFDLNVFVGFSLSVQFGSGQRGEFQYDIFGGQGLLQLGLRIHLFGPVVVTVRSGFGAQFYSLSSGPAGAVRIAGLAHAREGLGITPIAIDNELSIGLRF